MAEAEKVTRGTPGGTPVVYPDRHMARRRRIRRFARPLEQAHDRIVRRQLRERALNPIASAAA